VSGAPGTAPEPGAVEQARSLVQRARRIVVLTGAGISTDSGIPDFRGPQGLWTRDPAAEAISSLESYLSSEQTRRRSWRGMLAGRALGARPNAGHRALLELERRGTLELLVTQNTDGLHLDAGHDPERVVEIHGSNRRTACLRCGWVGPTAAVLARVAGGDEDPRCTEPASAPASGAGTPGSGAGSEAACGGLLKRTTILFGEGLVPADVARAGAAAARCDLLLAVGSTLQVRPAAGLVPLARRAGAAVVIVNASPTAHDSLAEVIVRGPIGEVLPELVGEG
jgi:NAD-dependent deacetylase